ncbi:uncharacterized protein BDZ99DRAFT_479448 [Mytilinidion resinicola]|uniref:Zn(2)-C6 fungal-type domain-containing protein n=1 Tax=Mytilinidion resinicola TaxID=574789 RepID=A0A6A6YBI2_9PEZI|nr:uncharacterized protein BDZ99DRAFT_479448 [Mytilinidion resinicola]KAF2806171.1 hypothetical protein BDZ99DRAFT_479448 [Mytilinidion resinicola]
MDTVKARRPRGPKPKTTYRVQNLENLAYHFQNELQSTSQSIIPETDSAQFVFYNDSTIQLSATAVHSGKAGNKYPTLPPNGHVDTVISLEEALYRTTEPKPKVKPQRVVARSIIEVFQKVDGFKYTERQASSTIDDGTRFKYVCADSLQNPDRVANAASRSHGSSALPVEKKPNKHKPTFDCGGSIFITFSLKKECINVVYRHNPIHGAYVSQEQGIQRTTSVISSDTLCSDSALPALENLPLAPVSQSAPTPKRKANPTTTAEAGLGETVTPKKRQRKNSSAVTQDEPMESEPVDNEPEFPVPVTPRQDSSPWLLQNTSSGFEETQNGFPSASSSYPQQLPTLRFIGQTQDKRRCLRTRCDSCHVKKIKCDGAKPSCSTCIKRSRICSYSET